MDKLTFTDVSLRIIYIFLFFVRDWYLVMSTDTLYVSFKVYVVFSINSVLEKHLDMNGFYSIKS